MTEQYSRRGLESIHMDDHPEIRDSFDRPPYAPTPINPYALRKRQDEREVQYFISAQELIMSLLEHNYNQLDTQPPAYVHKLMQASITNSLVRRFNNNTGKTLPDTAREEAARLFEKACLGKADQVELINLLALHPADLQSVEIAKMTHPYDWKATREMDEIVIGSLEVSGFRERGNNGRNLRYYFMNVDNTMNPKAASILRKADIATKTVDGHHLVAVQRDTFVLDLAAQEASRAADDLMGWLSRPETPRNLDGKKVPIYGGEIASYIERELDMSGRNGSSGLYPGVRSYYIHVEPN